MIWWLIVQGYMYNNSAETIADKWIEQGISAFPLNSYVRDSVRIATLNMTYATKKKAEMT